MTAFDVSDSIEGIAIIGLAGRFPGARNHEGFWENLKNGVESIRFFSDEELAREGVASYLVKNPNYVKANGVLDGIDLFDADFFGFTPREAEITDPQQRLFLECVWEALENAGYETERYRGAIGLFAGVSLNTYLIYNLLSNRRLIDKLGLLQTSIRNRTDHLTTHIAYKLNLKGPGVTVQTTCSTSLVAVHLACQALNSHHCDIALAGGVAITIPDKIGYIYQEGGINSPDGHCRAFDAKANGTVSGNGAGVVVLKRLGEALEDGDYIRAIIRSSAINNDGSEKIGYTAPSVSGQAEVIAMAQAIAGISPDQISYIEAHGTGTPLGDPIEIEALTQVFRSATAKKNFCAIGSVKTNIGHLDTAAGIAGLIKTTLALEHKQIPPSLHFTEPNPRIDVADSPFYVNAMLAPWVSNGMPRTAGVSSFGIGGTNAHVIVEEAPFVERRPSARSHHLLVVSARTASALESMTSNLASYLEQHPGTDLGDLAYTLQVGRRAFSHRRALVCQNRQEALEALTMTDPGKVVTGSKEAMKHPVAFMFPGQGSQYVNMALELYRSEECFREQIDRCSEMLEPHLGCRIDDILFPAETKIADASERLKQTIFAQPALFIVEYAQAQLWMQWGIHPEAMIGHSIGEYVAACLSGVLSLEDALKLVAARGRLMQGLPQGSMLSVQLTERETRSRLNGRLEIAAINSPSLCVVAGPDEAVNEFGAALQESGVICRRLHTSHAFHSSMMDPILDKFREVIQGIKLNLPKRPFISNLTGEWITNAEATSPAYWVEHLRHTVQFSKGIGKLFQDPAWILLEVGPGRALMTMARWHPEKPAGQLVLTSLPPADGNRPSAEFMLMTLGQLWISGVAADWESLHRDDPRHRLPLPTYPFERRRYWIAPNPAPAHIPVGAESLEKDPDMANWFYVPSWKRSVRSQTIDAQFTEEKSSSWLFFVDDLGLGRQMVERKRQAGDSVVAVIAADRFVPLGPQDYTINPARPEDYLELFAALKAEGPDRIVHLWSISSPTLEDPETIPIEQRLALSFYSLLHTAQAIGTHADKRKTHIDIVSSCIHEVTGGERVRPENATLIGPCKVIPQEYAGITCRIIDLDDASTLSGADLIEEIFAEIKTPGEETVAFRHHHRWVQLFEQVRLEAAGRLPARLRPQGVYLITGGLGGVGLALAQYLARQLQAKLVLIGRSTLPPRRQWTEWLATHGTDDRTSQKILGLLAIEADGAEIAYFSADVSDRSRMKEVVKQATGRFGPLNGVIHSAGLAGGGIIQMKTTKMANEVLAPKIAGAGVLQAVLQGQPLDFYLLCSSRSSLLGGFGGVDYCAANAFLDAFAHRYRQQTGTFAVSINWPAWQDVGMLAETAAAYRTKGPDRAGDNIPVGHPLIDRYLPDRAGRHVFHSRFEVRSRWVLDEHRILGKAIAPGVVYLEMARAAFEQAVQSGPVEIKDVYFLTPLHLNDDEVREVRLILESDGERYDFYLESVLIREKASAPAWQKHVIGKIAALPASVVRKVDIQGLIKHCRQKEFILTKEDFFDEDLGPRWQSMRHVYVGDNELVALVELPDEYAGELASFVLHPALMDRAAGFGILFLVERDSTYLPFSYHRLKVHGAIPQRFYVHTRQREDADPNKETTSFDIELLAEDGSVIVEVENFSHKRINEIAKSVKALTAGNQMPGESNKETPQEKLDEASPEEMNLYELAMSRGISPAEGAEVFARLCASVVPPQVIVSPNYLQAVIDRARQLRPDHYEAHAESLPAATSAHARPDIRTAYVPPGNEFENRIATLWRELLGIDRIGIHDNFFDLGGDSVLAIQIMAHAKKAGLDFTVQQLFQRPTIAELAAIAGGGQPSGQASESNSGEAPLLPSQHAFFGSDRNVEEAPGWALLLEVDPEIDPTVLEKGLLQMVASQEALRLVFEGGSSHGRAIIAPAPTQVQLEVIDLSHLASDNRLPAIGATARRLQSSLLTDQASKVKFALFQTGEFEKPVLLMVVHQLVADVTSAGRLLMELQSAIVEPQRSEKERLAPTTPRYQEIANKILEYSRSATIRQDAQYWLGLQGQNPPLLPARHSGSRKKGGNAAVYTVRLESEDTRNLLDQALRAYHTKVEDFLLAGLVRAFCAQTAEKSLWIDLQCRLTNIQDLNLANLVGPFTTVAPIILSLPEDDDSGRFLIAIKEQLRAIPRGGSSYAILCSQDDDLMIKESLQSLPRPQIKFSSLGEIEGLLAEQSTFRLYPADPFAGIGMTERQGYPIAISSFIHENHLKISWIYDQDFITDDSIRRLANQQVDEILRLVNHCVGTKATVFTPSDFPVAGLNSRKLEKIAELLEKADKSATR